MRPIFVFIIILVSLSAACAAENGWEALERFEFERARKSLATDAGAGNRMAAVGEALAILNRQPKTEAGVAEAETRLKAIATGSSGDDAAWWARFLLGRIAQIHRAPADPRAAAEIYRAVLADSPHHDAGQQALIKLALLLIYEPAVEPGRERGFAAAEALLPQASSPGAEVDLRLLLGRATMFFRGSQRVALTHFEAALRAGIANRQTRASTLYAAAELAFALGDRAQAREHYTAFFAENRRDQRANFVREQIVALGGKVEEVP